MNVGVLTCRVRALDPHQCQVPHQYVNTELVTECYIPTYLWGAKSERQSKQPPVISLRSMLFWITMGGWKRAKGRLSSTEPQSKSWAKGRRLLALNAKPRVEWKAGSRRWEQALSQRQAHSTEHWARRQALSQRQAHSAKCWSRRQALRQKEWFWH